MIMVCQTRYSLLLVVLAVISPCIRSVVNGSVMKSVYSWKSADYVFPDDASPKYFINSGEYNPKNIIILDASVWEQGSNLKVLLTTPRLRNGVPASLSIVTSKVRNSQNLLQPYPDWSWHRQNFNNVNGRSNWNSDGIDCNKMISVFRTEIDSCGRLWVVDTGFLHAVDKQVCPPKLLIFDLKNDKLISKYVFSKDVASKTSLLITIVVDIRNGKCDEAFAYIADVVDYKLVVYDHKRKWSWNVQSNLFYPYPLDGVFRINGVEFDLMDGLFGLALGPMENNDRMLFFHSLASVKESFVPTSVIRNQSLHADGQNKSPRSFQVFNDSRGSQSAAEVMTEDGILFFGLLSENALACWNTRFSYQTINIEVVSQDNERLQFISGLKVNNRRVWATSSRFQNYFTGVMDFNETNFRIMAASVEELVRATTCAIKAAPLIQYTTAPTFHPHYQTRQPYRIAYSSSYLNNRAYI